MNDEEMIKRLSAYITCLKCETSGKECDLNCATQYEAGNMGELIEMFETIAQKLEAGRWIQCSVRLPIEALNCSEFPNNSDTISRQDAIKDAESWVAVDEYEKHLQKGVVEWLKELPSAEPQKWNRLMMHLADLQLTYAPADGHGDAKLYEFVSGLIEELEGWTDGA